MSLDTIIGVVKRSICSIPMIYDLTIDYQLEIEAHRKKSFASACMCVFDLYFFLVSLCTERIM